MKKILLFLVALFASIVVFSAPISKQQAAELANKFIQNVSLDMQSVDNSNLVYTEFSDDNEPLFYIFNIVNDGFIIVSAQDFSLPIIGYSDVNDFDVDNIPVNFKSILSDYKAELDYAKSVGLTATEEIIRAREEQLAGAPKYRSEVGPLLGNIKWDQSPYYNDLCPVYNNYGSRVPVGCVATAMAQILKYWEYPAHGQGSHSYNHPDYGTQYADFDVDYNWAAMPAGKLTGPNAECAKISYHCAVSIDMQFGPYGSGAYQQDCPYSYINYFKYKNTTRNADRSKYSATNWANLVKTELDAGRPVQYAGSGNGGGHSFVCDGYNSNGYFHFNWGWGGQSDGYFALNALNPGSLGTGGGSGGFNSYQTIVIGIEPAEETTLQAPTGLAVGEVTTTTADVYWDSVDGASSYVIEIYANGKWQSFTRENTSVQFTGLTQNTTYQLRVKAIKGSAQSSYSSIVTFKTKKENVEPEVLPAPTGLAANNVTETTVDVSWNPVDNATSYIIEIYNNGKWESFTRTNTSVQITNLAPNTTYQLRVKALNDNTESDYSPIVKFTTLEEIIEPEVLPAPTGLAVTNVTETTVDVVWNAVDNATSYVIEIYVDTKWQSFTRETTSVQFYNLTPNTYYMLRVKAVNDNLESDYSSIVEFTTLEKEDPIEPDPDPEVEYCDSKSQSSYYEWIAKIAMANVDNESGASNYSDFTDQIINVNRGDVVPIYMKGGRRYYAYRQYWTIWIDFNHDGEFTSDELVVRGYYWGGYLLRGNITIPDNALLGQTRMRVSMKYGTYADPCEYFRYGEVEDYTINITDGSSYLAFNNNINEDSFDLLEGVAEELSVYPNPATEIIRLDIDNLQTECGYSIYDVTGRLVSQGVLFGSQEINVSNLDNGVYIISLDLERPIVTKFVKQ